MRGLVSALARITSDVTLIRVSFGLIGRRSVYTSSSTSSLADLVKKRIHENDHSLLSTLPMRAKYSWNDSARLAVFGGSAVARQIGHVRRSPVDMARARVEGLSLCGGCSPSITVDKASGQLLEAKRDG